MRPIDADALKGPLELQRESYARIGATARAEAYANCLWEIEQAPTVGGWISVKDKLPRIDEDVLILYESKVSRETSYAITCLKDSFYFGCTPIPYQTPQWSQPWQYFRENNVVTHWMSLPEPPQENKDD